MKFCTSCGNEMFDDAVICTKCGRMAVTPQFQQPAPQAPQLTPVNQAPVQGQGVPATKGKIINLTMTILSFVSSVFNSIALFLLAAILLTPYINLNYGYNYVSFYADGVIKRINDQYVVNAYIYRHWDLRYAVFAVFLFSSIICLTNIVLSACSRQRLEKLFPKIAKFVFAFLMMLAPTVFY